MNKMVPDTSITIPNAKQC